MAEKKTAPLRKSLGQHFLHDNFYLQKIIEAIQPDTSRHIIEIGAGDGALTLPLAQSKAHITSIEIDRRRWDRLNTLADKFANLKVFQGDALKVDISQIIHHKGSRMAGNLPYQISSQLILRFAVMEEVSDMHFLIQRELAQRLCAVPGTGDYGKFTLAVGAWRESQMLFDIPPEAFNPPPKVWSTLVRLGPLRTFDYSAEEYQRFEKIIHRAFQQKRKQLRNSLSAIVNEETYTSLGINPEKRAQDLTIEQFFDLSRDSLKGTSD